MHGHKRVDLLIWLNHGKVVTYCSQHLHFNIHNKCYKYPLSSFACFGLSTAVISYTIFTHEVSHEREGFGNKMIIFHKNSLLFDICTKLVLKTAEELFVPSVYISIYFAK